MSAESQSATANAVATASRISSWIHTTGAPGATRYQASITPSVAMATAQSTSGVTVAASGTSRRGKYTFEINCWLPTTDIAPPVTAVAKYVHGTSAENENSGYGKPSDGTCARRPRNTANTAIVSTGCRTAHAAPSVVCL